MRSALHFIQHNLSAITLVVIAVILIKVVVTHKRWNDRIIDNDVIHYYGYLPSTFIYQNLSLNFTGDDAKYLENKIYYSTTKEGKKVFKVSMGVAMGYFPFFIMAHGYALLTGQPANGFSLPYKFALVWGAVFYVMLGLIGLRKILRLWMRETTVSVALIIGLFGTNLYHYVVFDAAMSHVYSFTVITWFLWKCIQWHKKPSYMNSILIGLLVGWIFLIRPANLLAVLIFMGWGVNNLSSLKAKWQLFLQHWKMLLMMGLCAFICCIPQLLYWKTYSGSWLFYSYVGERFFFNHPRILEGLFSWRKGWLLYTPVMTLSLVGLFFIRKKVPELLVLYPLLMGLLLYITWSWWCWWYGGGFGQRSLVDWYGLMLIPIACLVESLFTKKIMAGALILFSGACIYLNILQHRQYKNTSVHFDSMTRKAYFYHFFSISKYPGLTPLLKSPDYEKALRGEREYFWE
jgi:hypothetical protein